MMAKIGPTGEVLHVRTLVPANYDERMVICPTQRLLETRFQPPHGGEDTVVMRLDFGSTSPGD